jgi:hypothetical protein
MVGRQRKKKVEEEMRGKKESGNFGMLFCVGGSS